MGRGRARISPVEVASWPECRAEREFVGQLIADVGLGEVRHLLSVFDEDVGRLTISIVQSAASGDFAAFRRGAHALAGAAGAVGAARLEEACRTALVLPSDIVDDAGAGMNKLAEAIRTQAKLVGARLGSIIAEHGDPTGSAETRLGRDRFYGFIGSSPPMQAAYRTIEAVAASKASVFVTGESGTGKELAAEAVHKCSPRASHAFVALNCAAIPRDLLESEVFGHVRGAFTGAAGDREGAAKAADGGTLFLDEIAEMPLDMQVKLLRFVQTGSFSPIGSSRTELVDVRFVCATNRDPMLEVQAGRFREDLYYRLYVVPIELPPLRQRGRDILLVARHFLAQFSAEESRRFKGFSPAAERALSAYSWPGNVRQLQNVVRNVVVLHDGETVEAEMIPPPVLRSAPSASHVFAEPSLEVAADETSVPPALPPLADAASLPLPDIEIMPLAEMERRLILAALASCANDVPRAAALLEINPSTIYRKLQIWKARG